jgi:uncharacterized NAD(P)/FAD-binding protein YdhS
VLAIGNVTAEETIPGYIANPWSDQALADLNPAAPVLLIGTGLTMVDMVISLLDQGHTGPIHAISRRGLLPRRHEVVTEHRRFLPAASAPRTVLGLLRAVRAEIERAGGD